MNPHLVFLFGLALLTLIAFGSFIVTPGARILVDPLVAEAKSQGYQRKQIAAFQELTEGQWRRQVEAEDGQHVSAYRLALAPPDVIRGWLTRLCPAYGLRALDERDQMIALVERTEDLVKLNRELIASIGLDPDYRRQLQSYLAQPEQKEIA